MMVDAAHASVSADTHCVILSGSLVAMTSRAAMHDGPAIRGMASGTTKGSPSSVSGSGEMTLFLGKTMPRAIRNRRIPPEMHKVASRSPRKASSD